MSGTAPVGPFTSRGSGAMEDAQEGQWPRMPLLVAIPRTLTAGAASRPAPTATRRRGRRCPANRRRGRPDPSRPRRPHRHSRGVRVVGLVRQRRRIVEKSGSGHEEEAAGDRSGEIKDPVVVAGRITEKHALQHQLGDRGCRRIADEVRTELPGAQRSEGHVLPQIWRWVPSGSMMVFSATCELDGLTSSSISTLDSLVRPITRSCSSTLSASQAAMSCRYFCTMT